MEIETTQDLHNMAIMAFARPDPVRVEVDSYETARQRVADLRAQLKAKESELATATAALAIGQDDAAKAATDAAAARLYAGGDLALDPAILVRNADRLRRELDVIAAALRLARDAFTREKRAQARQIVAELTPAHRRACAKIAAALALLAEGNAEEMACRAKVPGGTGINLTPANFPGVGSPHELGSPAHTWTQYARRHGLLVDAFAEAAE